MKLFYLLVSVLTAHVIDSAVTHLDLGGSDWFVSNNYGNITARATVPGGIYTDLYNAGILTEGPLYYKFNDQNYRWVSKHDWIYEKTFTVDSSLLSETRVVLVLEGVDTVSRIEINGKTVGATENQFVQYIFDVKDKLKEGENKMRVLFESPVKYSDDMYEQHLHKHGYPVLPECVVPHFRGECHANHIRKIQSSFAWDWGPAFPSMGIWQNIRLEAYSKAVYRYFTIILTERAENDWLIDLKVFFETATKEIVQDPGEISLKLMDLKLTFTRSNFEIKPNEDHEAIVEVSFNLKKVVSKWWPNGYGDQKLYAAILSTNIGGEKSEEVFNIGFRTVELVQEPINGSEGLSFYFKVNKVAIFAKGNNWTPVDSFLELVTPDYYRHLMTSAKLTHMNMMRVWGGGLYEPRFFYELADELGIMIWQDFIFACSMYPATDGFLNLISKEVRHQVRRLQRHPSIVLWAGNNENEAALKQNWYGTSSNNMYPVYKADYIKLYVDAMKPLVEKEDPSRCYLPSSPSNGKQTEAEGWVAENPQSNFYGDVHYYNYYINSWDWRDYPRTRFTSEYGFQSWPSFETIQEVTTEKDWSYFSRFTVNRQHHPLGMVELPSLVSKNLRVPADLHTVEGYKKFLYLMQIEQAMGTKIETEMLRRSRSEIFANGEGGTMGALFWQSHDIWQGASWAAIEYGGKWKMLQYFAANFFAPLHVSCYDDEDNINVYVVSDLLHEQQVVVNFYVYSWDSFIPKYVITKRKSQPALTSQSILKHKTSEMLSNGGCSDVSECFFYMTIQKHGESDVAHYNFHYPVGLTSKDLPRANIKITSVRALSDKEFEICLSTDAIAPFTWLEAWGIKGHFSDNGFVMVHNKTEVVFYSRSSTSVSDLQNALSVHSLMDAYDDEVPRVYLKT